MTYVISDLHGQYDKFIKILDVIDLKEEDTLYILGDIVDRGPEPIKLFQRIMKMKNIVVLLGNHEDMMLNAIEYMRDSDFILWYRNGGGITHSQFKELCLEEQEKILEYIRKMPYELKIEVNKKIFYLVHGAFPSFSKEIYGNENLYKEDILWSRVHLEDEPPNDVDFVVFGHTPTFRYQNPDDFFHILKYKKLIDVDCGLAAYSIDKYREKVRLGCICLDTMEEFYV